TRILPGMAPALCAGVRFLLLATLQMYACSSPSRPVEAKVGLPNTSPVNVPGHGSGRNRWHGGGVYLDGEPIAVLRYAELPRHLAPIMEVPRTRLTISPGQHIR